MATLPNTGITTSMVARAIGASTNDVGALCCHSNVNQFGFNSPDINQMKKYWGKTVQERIEQGNGYLTPGAIGYPLGVFRKYDHDWVTFKGDSPFKSPESDSYWKPLKVRIPIPVAAAFLLDKPAVSVQHTFDVYFNRINDFTHGSETQIADNITGSSPYLEININLNNPPDGGSALQENDVFYIKVVHVSSPERRWFVPGWTHLEAAAGGDYYIGSVTVPEDPYTYSLYNGVPVAIFVENPSFALYTISVDIYADMRTSSTVNIKAQLCKNSAFEVDVLTMSDNFSYSANTQNPGTAVLSGNALFDFTTQAKQLFNAGNTAYYRINFNNAGYGTVYSKQVLLNLPQD